MTELWDVVIIGSGPAGSSAAYRLSKTGFRVLILEKHNMPREKLCGGVVSTRALKYLDFSIPENVINTKCDSMRIHYGKQSTRLELAHPFAILTTRSKFDYFLLQKAILAGACARYESARFLSVEGEKVVIHTLRGIYYARIAVIATGVASKLSRVVRRKDHPDEIGFCLTQNYVPKEGGECAELDAPVNVYFGLIKYGYNWVFDHGAFRSVGIGGILSRQSKPQESMRSFWSKLGYPDRDLNPKGCFFPIGGIRRQIVRSRVILVGDAAGFADPFSGEGIPYAIRSGQLAAKTAQMALASASFSKETLSLYGVEIHRHFGHELTLALHISRITHKWPSIFLQLCIDPAVLRQYLKTVIGDSTYFRFYFWMMMRMPFLFAKNRINKARTPKGLQR